MAINILDLEPTKVSRDLRSKYILIYGKQKIGKTSFACSIPDALILATEKGYNAISGVYAQDIRTWADAKIVVNQLRTPAAKEKFKSVVIDTFTILSDLCEKYVCDINGVQAIGDIPWGAGYAQFGKELNNFIRDITMEGYGLVLIAHSKEKNESVGEDQVITHYAPDLSKRAMAIANQAVDIIAFATEKWTEEKSERLLVCRQTPTILAGSRFPEFPNVVPLNYDAVVNALADAIEKQSEHGDAVVDEAPEQAEQIDFKALQDEAKKIYSGLVNPQNPKEVNDANLKKIRDFTEKTLGVDKPLSAIQENEIEAFEIIVDYMKGLQ